MYIGEQLYCRKPPIGLRSPILVDGRKADGALPRCYNELMLDEITFRRNADAALESLKQSLIVAEETSDFEVEEQNGALNIVFDEPPGKFVVTPNAPVRQIWISALSTSFKLDWSDEANDFVSTKGEESFKPLIARLINVQLGIESVVLT